MSYQMTAPEVQSSVTGKVPNGIYTVRATKTSERTDRAPKGYMRTIIACEIVAPDIAVDESSPDKTRYSVARPQVPAVSPDRSDFQAVFRFLLCLRPARL